VRRRYAESRGQEVEKHIIISLSVERTVSLVRHARRDRKSTSWQIPTGWGEAVCRGVAAWDRHQMASEKILSCYSAGENRLDA